MPTLATDPVAVAGPLEITPLLAGTAEVLASLLRADWAGTIEIVEDQSSLRQTTWSLTAKDGRSPPDVQMASRLAARSMAAWALDSGRSVVCARSAWRPAIRRRDLEGSGDPLRVVRADSLLGRAHRGAGAYRDRNRPFSGADVLHGREDRRAAGGAAGGDSRPTVAAGVSGRVPCGARQSAGRQAEESAAEVPLPAMDRRSARRGLAACQRLSPGRVPGSLGRRDCLLPGDPPPFENLIVALGTAKHRKHYRARVMRVQTLEEGGRRRIVVGCRFTERVSIS